MIRAKIVISCALCSANSHQSRCIAYPRCLAMYVGYRSQVSPCQKEVVSFCKPCKLRGRYYNTSGQFLPSLKDAAHGVIFATTRLECRRSRAIAGMRRIAILASQPQPASRCKALRSRHSAFRVKKIFIALKSHQHPVMGIRGYDSNALKHRLYVIYQTD